MLSRIGFVLVSLICAGNSENSSLPSYIKPCEYKDPKLNDCIKNQIELALPSFTKGIPEMGVPSLDPVKLDDILVDGNGLKLKFSEAAMYGISKSKLSQLLVSLGHGNENFSLSFIGNMSLVAKYVVDGRILILPVQGKGDAIVNATNVEIQIDSKLLHVKDNKSGEHFKLGAPKYKYDIEKTTFQLDNLFNGNKQLAETTIQFANQNWRQLMDELAPPAIKQIVRTCVRAINKFFSNMTIQQIIPGYKV